VSKKSMTKMKAEESKRGATVESESEALKGLCWLDVFLVLLLC
jgi:hypothetical protein